jgi:hypothetical protein
VAAEEPEWRVAAVHTGGGSILEEKKPTHSSLYRDGLLGAKVEICPRGRSAGGDLAVVRTGVRRLCATEPARLPRPLSTTTQELAVPRRRLPARCAIPDSRR